MVDNFCPRESLERVLAFSSRDWSVSPDDAWIYGIVLGWNNESLKELQQLHGWNDSTIKALKVMHLNFTEESKWE